MKSNNNLCVVITTINVKSRGIIAYESVKNLNILLIGDKKTPLLTNSNNSIFYAVDAQEELGLSIASKLPYNHYARKNIGYLLAMRQGASIIYDTDDDNFPLDNWYIPDFFSDKNIKTDSLYFNIYKYFTDKKVWPRGLPLNYVNKDTEFSIQTFHHEKIGIWQGLANGDPDVDAIYRLTNNESVIFNDDDAVSLLPHHYCPFNSQNTFWKSEFFILLYLPATTSFRFTDILRGYIAQRLLWEQNNCLGFMKATVFQDRNKHDYMKDFEEEIVVYMQVEKVVSILETITLTGTLANKLRSIYEELCKMSIVESSELELLDLWIYDYMKIFGRNG